MKILKTILIVLMLMFTMSCDESGKTYTKLNGDESGLPTELKGLKVYRVATDGGSFISVAILNGDVNSVSRTESKTIHTTIIVNGKEGSKTIYAKEILSENDSIIVIRK